MEIVIHHVEKSKFELVGLVLVRKDTIKEFMDHVSQLNVLMGFNGILEEDNVTQCVKGIMKFW